MEIRFLNQPKDVKFVDILSENLRSGKFNKVWIIAGFTKDSALDMIIDDVKIARENGTIIECVFGLDKKNTSKDMLNKYLDLGCNIRYHINDEGAKLESRLFVFESQDDTSYVYITGGKFSEGGISNNLSIIEEVSYSPDEKIELGKVKATIENGMGGDLFSVLSYDALKELAATGDIVARITERKIPKISELYSKEAVSEDYASKEYNEETSNEYKDLLNKDVDIDIDMGDGEVTLQDSLGEEVEHKLKVDEKEKETVITKIVNTDKAVDFDSISTLIIPISGKQADDEIRITSSITQNMFKFLGYPDDFHTEEDEKENIKESKKINLEVFENIKKETNVDSEAEIIQSIKYTTIKSSAFKSLQIENEDIIRLIKNSKDDYICEIIKKETEEYKIWEGFCTQTVKGSTKKFGVM